MKNGKSVDNGGAFGALLTDLSKTFDCVSHELLIVKLDAYGFDKWSLVLIYNYLSNRKQRVKINDSSSSWSDMFYFMVNFEIANYADGSTPFSAKLDCRSIPDKLEISSSILFTYLRNNYMKANTDKSNLLLSGKNNLTPNIGGNVIESEDNQVLLGITINSNLSFNKHINNLCKKASAKQNALAKISDYMNLLKCRITMKSFMISQFDYCPLIWMFHSKTLNNNINSIHERALRISNDRKSSFEELLRKDNTLSIHHRNVQVLATEIFKIKNNMAPKILNEVFQNRTSSYGLQKGSRFYVKQVHSVYRSTESLSFLGSKIW